MLYRKIDSNGLFVEDVILNKPPYKMNLILKTEYVLENEEPKEIQYYVDEPTGELEDCYVEGDVPQGFYHPRWNGEEWVEGGTAPTESTEQKIARLQAELEDTDYKIIKCSECSLAGEPLPYDIVALHRSRQTKRDEINELEIREVIYDN